jgi:alkylhydroperoxidase family enzyme
VRAVKRDYREAALSPGDRRMLDFAVKLTRSPSSMTEGDVDGLRAHGFGDEAIHEICRSRRCSTATTA